MTAFDLGTTELVEVAPEQARQLSQGRTSQNQASAEPDFAGRTAG